MRTPTFWRVLFGVWLPLYVLQLILAWKLRLPIWAYLLELALFIYVGSVLGRLSRK